MVKLHFSNTALRCMFSISRIPKQDAKAKSKCNCGASLVAQWLRIRLPMQGTRVRALAWEDPTCRGAAKPVHHNY